MLFLEFGLCLFCWCYSAVLHGPLGLAAIMLCFYVCIQGWIGKIFFTTTTNEIPPLDIFSWSPTRLTSFQLVINIVLLLSFLYPFLLVFNFLFLIDRGIHLLKIIKMILINFNHSILYSFRNIFDFNFGILAFNLKKWSFIYLYNYLFIYIIYYFSLIINLCFNTLPTYKV